MDGNFSRALLKICRYYSVKNKNTKSQVSQHICLLSVHCFRPMTRKLQLNPCHADVKEAVFWRNAATVSMTGSRVMQIQLVRAGPSALGKLSTCFLSTARRGPPISALCPWAQSIQRLLRRCGFELCFQESKAYRQGVRCGRGKGVSVGFPGTGNIRPIVRRVGEE